MAKHEDTNEKAQTAQDASGVDRDDLQAHGWGPAVDDEQQEDNDSAHRSFHPEKYAPEPGRGRTVSEEESGTVAGDTVESIGSRGEGHAKKDQKGHHDTGAKGASQRPSGSKDADAVTGVDPQSPAGRHGG